MIVDGKTMKVKYSGFYSNGQRVSAMREDDRYKMFQVQNVFKGPLPVPGKDYEDDNDGDDVDYQDPAQYYQDDSD